MSTTILTAPDMLDKTVNTENTMVIAMSTTFYPRDDPPTNLTIITSDSVFFSVYESVLLFQSVNSFGGLLIQPGAQCFIVPESSEVFNLVLHAFYDLDPAHYKPSLNHLASMLTALSQYGLSLDIPLTPGKPIYNLLSTLAYTSPLEVYTLAAEYGLEQLAVETSRHLHTIRLDTLTDEHCRKMGPIYLRRLFFLHLGRTERLKKLLSEPPGHEPTLQCDAQDQEQRFHAVWKEGVALLCWDVNASTPTAFLRAALSPIVDRVACEECKIATKEKIRQLVIDWSLVKSTI